MGCQCISLSPPKFDLTSEESALGPFAGTGIAFTVGDRHGIRNSGHKSTKSSTQSPTVKEEKPLTKFFPPKQNLNKADLERNHHKASTRHYKEIFDKTIQSYTKNRDVKARARVYDPKKVNKTVTWRPG